MGVDAFDAEKRHAGSTGVAGISAGASHQSEAGALKPRLEHVFVNLDEALARHLADLDLSRPRSAALSQ